MPYTIQINEYQRAMLVQIMQSALQVPDIVRHLATQPPDHEQLIVFQDDSMWNEAITVMELLQDMPNVQGNDTEMIHGFCL